MGRHWVANRPSPARYDQTPLISKNSTQMPTICVRPLLPTATIGALRSDQIALTFPTWARPPVAGPGSEPSGPRPRCELPMGTGSGAKYGGPAERRRGAAASCKMAPAIVQNARIVALSWANLARGLGRLLVRELVG